MAGEDEDGSPVYVGRAYNFQHWLPATIIPRKKQCFVPFGCYAVSSKSKIEIVTGTEFEWINASIGYVPGNAEKASLGTNGEILYIGRVKHENAMCVGKVFSLYASILFPYKGKEVNLSNYEVFCVPQKSKKDIL